MCRYFARAELNYTSIMEYGPELKIKKTSYRNEHAILYFAYIYFEE